MNKSGSWLLLAAAAVLPGCTLVPVTEWNATQAQSRALSEQNRAQLAEIDDLQAHCRTVEDRLLRGERQLAVLQERAGVNQRELEGYQREHDGPYGQFQGTASAHGRLPPELSRQLADLSRRYPSLQFDPETGLGKLDTDILFDTGRSTLKPGTEHLLDELAGMLNTPAAGELKIMIAGHTDDQSIADRAIRQQYPNNFHLSTARALAVADRLKRAGLSERRMAVAGFGRCEPISSNATAADRQKSRGLEIFVVPPDVPVVGWSESTSSVYGAGSRR